MKNLLEFILTNITTNPDAVNVEEQIEDGAVHFVISVDPEDVGRVIGKEGKIIKAIRSIMRVAAIQKGQRVRVTVLSDNDGAYNDNNSSDDIVVESDSTEEMNQSTEDSPQLQVEDSEDSLTIEVPEE